VPGASKQASFKVKAFEKSSMGKTIGQTAKREGCAVSSDGYIVTITGVFVLSLEALAKSVSLPARTLIYLEIIMIGRHDAVRADREV
jgi:hypothetical protein